MNEIRLGATLVERFWELVERRGGEDGEQCWPWLGATNAAGHGQLALGRGSDRLLLLAHRVGYEIQHGPIPAGMTVWQACGNPACCNGRHLLAGTGAGIGLGDARTKMPPRPAPLMIGVRGTAHPRAVWSADDRARALSLHASGATRVAIAQAIGCSRVTAARWIEEAILDSGTGDSGGRALPSLTYLRSRPAGVLA